MSSPDSPVTYFAGFDWAKHSHHVVIVNAVGQIVTEFSFEHTQAGWQQWRQQAARFAPLAVAIETSQGTVVDQLLQTPACTVFPMNPNAARAYRDRKAPSGTKSDHLDAWSFADALRLDSANWKPLSRQDPLLEQLQLLCRDEIALIEERTALVNQLQAALHEYYPVALEALRTGTAPGPGRLWKPFRPHRPWSAPANVAGISSFTPISCIDPKRMKSGSNSSPKPPTFALRSR